MDMSRLKLKRSRRWGLRMRWGPCLPPPKPPSQPRNKDSTLCGMDPHHRSMFASGAEAKQPHRKGFSLLLLLLLQLKATVDGQNPAPPKKPWEFPCKYQQTMVLHCFLGGAKWISQPSTDRPFSNPGLETLWVPSLDSSRYAVAACVM